MSISFWLDDKSKKQLNYDFVIVGAGIAGVSTAYWLEKSFPDIRIALIERNKLGFGASGRNAGFVTCGSAEHFAKLEKQFGLAKATEIWRFSEANRELLEDQIMQGNADSVFFKKTGSCTVAPSDSDWTRYQDLVHTMKNQGIDVELIAAEKMSADYGVKNFKGGIQYKHDGVVHPILLLKKIFAKLTRTTLFENEEVFKFSEGAVETDRHHFTAEKIILTLNPHLSQLDPLFSPHLKPQRGQIFVSEPLPAFVKGPCYLTKHLCYFRQMPTGELLIGGFRNVDLENENTFLDQATEKIQSSLLDFAKGYFGFGEKIKVKYQWSGIMGFTEDGQMLIGEHPRLKSFSLMAGCSGHGMGLSFHAAKTLVGSFLGKEIPSHLDVKRIKL